MDVVSAVVSDLRAEIRHHNQHVANSNQLLARLQGQVNLLRDQLDSGQCQLAQALAQAQADLVQQQQLVQHLEAELVVVPVLSQSGSVP